MLLAYFLSHSASPHTVGQWRLPRSYQGLRYDRPEYWEHVARTAERGGIDTIFLSDSYSIYETFRGSSDDTLRYAVQCPRHDPLPLIPIMARVTQSVGFVTTLSTAFLPPFWTARTFATLDHLTEGRVGWNLVTTAGEQEGRQFGQPLDDHDTRYRRAAEYLALCQTLWDSWAPDAVLADRESGEFADPGKIAKIDFQGEYFSSQGRFTVPHSPQGRPLIAQAGSSGTGAAFAGRHAELVFGLRHSTRGMREFVARVRHEAIAAGRAPDAVRVLWGVVPIVAETREEALRKQQAIRDNVTVEAGLTMLSAFLNVDLSRYDPAAPFPDIGGTSGIRGHLATITEDFAADTPLAVIARHFAAGQGPHVVGTPAEVADQLQSLLEEGGGDGFILITHALPTCMDEFTDLVVPELRRRGLRPPGYAHKTLRERVQAGPLRVYRAAEQAARVA
ncbi:NtaA/DmoA family FMN-dependent monooxygenase [Paraburkholderia sp. BCC1886]|uniref:NtaA/DmoA family FMN-dependent monooxygenase n=1 Tax=Paraburkholderia sp. BCC1886 TaxID=2562670 RepID=UPI001183F44C|nr:NtaA/DmoA family FMN-dependent monooxygenase [Paraburkholderia sp. BCC1886]